MATAKDTGLAVIARSKRKAEESKPAQDRGRSTAGAVSQIELAGWKHHTSIKMDDGIFDALADTVYAIKKRLRGTSRTPVSVSQVLEVAFIMFHELPLDQQTELVRKHRDR